MAKAVSLVSVLFIVAFARIAHSHDSESEVFRVEGDVFCDPCRVQFQTPLSQKLPGAGIRVECINIDTKAITYTVNGTTDSNGHYVVEVKGEHEDDICEVQATSSPDAECNVPMTDMAMSHVVCSANTGINTDVRYANPVGFMTNEASPHCASVLEELFAEE